GRGSASRRGRVDPPPEACSWGGHAGRIIAFIDSFRRAVLRSAFRFEPSGLDAVRRWAARPVPTVRPRPGCSGGVIPVKAVAVAGRYARALAETVGEDDIKALDAAGGS